ncbi:hypothetical protein IWX65_000013 [Arthrobacter sp. CAN_A214]|uniref:hypothetical protein n=1 Tax=Arthrobacter sp. CAN_A214 TaxID=2787720 RepID=UPI0018C90E19
MSTPQDPLPRRPASVVVLALVLLGEALALAALALGYILSLLGPDPLSVGGAVFMIVFLLLLAAGVLAAARGLLGGYRWPRTPSLVLQIFLVIFSVSFLSAGAVAAGIVVFVPAGTALVLLFTQPVVAFTVRNTGESRIH